MSSLALRGVTKEFAGRRVVEDVSLDLPSGSFLSIVGPSGCGKTTLLRIIAGFESATSGTILVDGREIGSLPARVRGIGMVFQNYALFPHMTAQENVAFGLEGRGLARAEVRRRAEEMLELVGLLSRADAPVPTLSGGEQQRIAVARALAPRPVVLLMDEPLSNLDIALRQTTREEIRSLQRRLGITTVYVTHDQGEAMSLSDRIAVMSAGRVQQEGSPPEVYEDPATGFVAGFVGGALLLPALVDRDQREVSVGDHLFRDAAPRGVDHGGSGVLSLPPEAVRVCNEPKPGMHTAEVATREYLGFTTAFVLVDGDLRLRAMVVSSPASALITVGSHIGYDIHWQRCTFFPA
jgi:ABC-type Fe3+/spermidine/putrescine transport system ATPase subunit